MSRAGLLFQEPEVASAIMFRYFYVRIFLSRNKSYYNVCFFFTLPHEEGLVKFLRGDEQFNEQQVRNGAKKLHTSAD